MHGFSNHYEMVIIKTVVFKVEYDANENPLKHSEKIVYIGQRLIYPIIKK